MCGCRVCDGMDEEEYVRWFGRRRIVIRLFILCYSVVKKNVKNNIDTIGQECYTGVSNKNDTKENENI